MEPEPSSVGAMRVGEWLVEPSLNRLSRGDTAVHVRPKAMDVLVVLARQPGQVVSRETIIDTVWAKKFLADSALASAISELRKALGDDPQSPCYIETIQKRGYRLKPPVTTEGSSTSASDTVPSMPLAPARDRRVWQRYLMAAGLMMAVSVAVVLAWRSAPKEPVLLEVVRFENLGPAEVAYFAAGITEEIAARLAAVPGLRVVTTSTAAPRSTMAAAGLANPGVAAGPDHILRGSVRWAGQVEPDGLVRITPQLIRVRDGATVWSAVYERSMKDVFAIQTEIARAVAIHLEGMLKLTWGGITEPPATADPEAHAAYLRGLYDVGDLANEEDQLRATLLFEQAIARDPSYLAPYVALVRTNALLYHFGIDRSPQRLAAARGVHDRLVAIAPGRAETMVASAYLDFAEMEFNESLAKLEAAGSAARLPFGLGHRADIVRRLGRFEEALEMYPKWLGGTPTRAAYIYEEIGVTQGCLTRWEVAQSAFASAINLDPGRHSTYAASAQNVLLLTRSVALARAELDRDTAGRYGHHRPQRWLFALCEGDYDEALGVLAGLPAGGTSTEFQRVPTSLRVAETYRLRGDSEAAQQAFEAARVTLERELSEKPGDFRGLSALGIAYAGLGRRQDAVRSGEGAVALCPVGRDALRGGFYLGDLALIHVMTGANDEAARTLEKLLTGPRHPDATPVLDLDPRWAPLRSHAAYPRLLSLLGGSRGTTTVSATL